MYLERTPEQHMLFETAARFFRAQSGTAPWRSLGKLGLISAALPEAAGGLSGKAADIAPVCEAIAVSGAMVPYFSSALLPAALLAASAFAGRDALLERFMSGEARIAVAHSEASLVFSCENPATSVDAARARLHGRKRRVWDAATAHSLIVSAQSASGLGWYVVETRDPGVHVQSVHEMDGMSSADVVLTDAACIEILSGEAARAALDRAVAFAVVGVLAKSVASMGELIDAVRSWLTERKQFGRPLWSNQVLQHRVVDMFVALEEARSMLNLAIYAYDRMPQDEQGPALHAAKAHIANCSRYVGQQAVHLHGAMGLTEEASVGPRYRRLEALQALFGGADHHTWAYASCSTRTG